jgi:HD-GYP domain-containing protein (c-di-GMP phosphodiesterase class II)
MELIRTHAETGYQMIKDISFFTPLAEIIRQHHERMDGSGYPRGLKGEEILPEARVLAVADVFEAMTSHRPYRPAPGVEAALAELSRRSIYDAAPADALTILIWEKDYRIPTGRVGD